MGLRLEPAVFGWQRWSWLVAGDFTMSNWVCRLEGYSWHIQRVRLTHTGKMVFLAHTPCGTYFLSMRAQSQSLTSMRPPISARNEDSNGIVSARYEDSYSFFLGKTHGRFHSKPIFQPFFFRLLPLLLPFSSPPPLNR
ncbi:hypothetical protein ACJW30_04G131300 [Castanea mollissima]